MQGNFGTQLTALIAYLTVVCSMPWRVVEALLQQVLGVEMSLGSTQKCWEEASQAVALPCQELEEQLKDEPVLNVDETGWRTNGDKRPFMNIKYIGMDVHKETISIAVMNADGKLVMESIIETKASTILQFIQGLCGDLHVTFEGGTWAAWLYDLLKPHVTKLVVCDPRKNAVLKEGNKSDKIDARKLADLLHGGYLRSIYHGQNGLRTLKELARSYLTISKDLTRVNVPPRDLRSLINEPHPVAQHAIDQANELGRHSLGRHRSVQPPFQLAKLPYQIAVALPQGAGSHAQNHVQPVIRGQSPFANYPVATDSVVRRKS